MITDESVLRAAGSDEPDLQPTKNKARLIRGINFLKIQYFFKVANVKVSYSKMELC